MAATPSANDKNGIDATWENTAFAAVADKLNAAGFRLVIRLTPNGTRTYIFEFEEGYDSLWFWDFYQPVDAESNRPFRFLVLKQAYVPTRISILFGELPMKMQKRVGAANARKNGRGEFTDVTSYLMICAKMLAEALALPALYIQRPVADYSAFGFTPAHRPVSIRKNGDFAYDVDWRHVAVKVKDMTINPARWHQGPPQTPP